MSTEHLQKDYSACEKVLFMTPQIILSKQFQLLKKICVIFPTVFDHQMSELFFWKEKMLETIVYLLLFSRVWLFCDPMGRSPLCSSVHGIFPVRTLEWVDILFSRGPSRPRDWTSIYCTDRQILYHWATKELHAGNRGNLLKSISLLIEDSSFYQSLRVILCNWWDLLIHSLNSYLLRMFCQEIH